MKWPQSYTAEGFGAIGCRPGQRGPRGSNLSHAQPTPSRTARTSASPGAQRRRRPNHPAAPVGARGGQRRERLGRFSSGFHAHQPQHEAAPVERLGDLLQCPPLGGPGKRGKRVHHRGRDSRPAPPRTGNGLRWAGAGCEHSDPLPHPPALEPQLRAAGPVHRVRRSEGRGRPPERLRRPALRTAPAGRGARSTRGDTREPVHARLRDPRHPRERAATGVPDAGRGDSRSGNAAPHGAATGRSGRGAQGRSSVRGGVPAPLLRHHPQGRRPAIATRGGSHRRSDLARGLYARRGFRPGYSHRGRLGRRRFLRSAVAAQRLARADSPRGSGPAGHSRGGRSPLRLPWLHARRRAELPSEGRRAAHARPHRPLQAQCLPSPSHGRRGLANRNPEPPRAHRAGRATRPPARLGPTSAARVRLGPRRRSALGQRFSFPRRLRRDPALRGGAAHRGDPRARDAGSRARRDQGHAGEPAVPAQRSGRPLGVRFAPELPRQRDEPGARVDVPLHRARGRRPRGDAPRGGKETNIPNPDFAARGWRAYVWNNVPGGGAEDLAYRLANGGYDVVLSPVSNLYFDLAWNENPEETGLDWGGYVDLRKPFDFIPFDYYRNVRVDPSVFVGKDRLTDYGRAHVVGIQGNLWSETLGGDGRLEYMMLPKLFGLAERAWAPDPDWARERDPAKSESLYREAWSRFVNVLGQRELPRLDREVPGVNYRIPTPGLKVEDGVVRCSVELPGFILRYTTDGSEPTVRSALVRGPIPLRGTVRVAAFNTTGRKGHTARLTAP